MSEFSFGGFDATQVAPNVLADPVPEGPYTAVITESDVLPVKDKPTSNYLSLTFQVIEGPYQGRRIRSILNLWNHNAVAVEIAKAELSAICRAVGVLRPSSSQDLHGIPVVITVGLRRRDDNNRWTNRITAYASAPAATPAAATPPNVLSVRFGGGADHGNAPPSP